MVRALPLVATLVAVVAGPGSAQATDGDAPRTTAVYAVAGIGTPLGVVGVEGVHRLEPNLEIAAGVGLGLSAERNASLGHAVQWAFMPRYRVGTDRGALTIGLGVSGGNYTHTLDSLCGSDFEGPFCNSPNVLRYTLWANVEVGGEHWFPTGFVFRYFVGYGRVLAQGANDCASNTDCNDHREGILPYYSIPYFGVGFGRAF